MLFYPIFSIRFYYTWFIMIHVSQKCKYKSQWRWPMRALMIIFTYNSRLFLHNFQLITLQSLFGTRVSLEYWWIMEEITKWLYKHLYTWPKSILSYCDFSIVSSCIWFINTRISEIINKLQEIWMSECKITFTHTPK